MMAEQVIKYLSDQGFGALGEALFFGVVQDLPDEAIFARDVSAPVLPVTQGYGIDQSGVQLTVRSLNSFTARNKARDIYNLLVSFRMDTFTADGNPVIYTETQSPPAHIGMDAKGRHEYTTTFTIRHDR
jgi:hypothetical protein